MMIVRKASGDEMLHLWGYGNTSEASPTAKHFYQHLSSGNAVFWTMEKDGKLIGELYVYFDLADKDFADGRTTAYLCAFRIQKEYRGNGFGIAVMNTALTDLKAAGFQRATIGVEIEQERNIRLYHRMGFTKKIKVCRVDPCDMDENMQPRRVSSFWLLSKEL